MKQFRSSRRLFVQRELLGEYMICLFYAVFPADFTGNTIYYLNSTDFCGIL